MILLRQFYWTDSQNFAWKESQFCNEANSLKSVLVSTKLFINNQERLLRIKITILCQIYPSTKKGFLNKVCKILLNFLRHNMNRGYSWVRFMKSITNQSFLQECMKKIIQNRLQLLIASTKYNKSDKIQVFHTFWEKTCTLHTC